MSKNLIETWERFRGVLQLYGDAASLLNPPCPAQRIRRIESGLRFELPPPLKDLLALNNGQKSGAEPSENGIFKSVSGWDVYERQVFLGIGGIAKAYKTFVEDEVLVDEFGTSEIPFAVAGDSSEYKEAFCINRSSQAVSLIWTQYFDPSNPPEWQVYRFERAKSLTEFIEKQIELYR